MTASQLIRVAHSHGSRFLTTAVVLAGLATHGLGAPPAKGPGQRPSSGPPVPPKTPAKAAGNSGAMGTRGNVRQLPTIPPAVVPNYRPAPIAGKSQTSGKPMTTRSAGKPSTGLTGTVIGTVQPPGSVGSGPPASQRQRKVDSKPAQPGATAALVAKPSTRAIKPTDGSKPQGKPSGATTGSGSPRSASSRPQAVAPSAPRGGLSVASPRTVRPPTLVATQPPPSLPPRVRVRVRSGSGSDPSATQAPTMAGPPRVTVPLTPRGGRRSGGNDDDEVGAAGGAQAALTAEESRTVAETRDRFYGDQGGESIYDPETDRHIAEGLDAMLNDQELSDEQVAAIRGLADTPRDLDAGQTDVWDRLDAELNADAGAIRGSIYTGLQEDAQRRSESQGEAAGSVPVLPAEVNNDLAILRDILLTAEPAEGVSREQQAAAAAGIDAVLRGGTMTEEQSAAVAAAANSSSDTAFRMAAGFVGGSDFRGSLFAALAANRDAQTAQAGGIDRGAAAIAQSIRDAFETLTGGTAGAGILLPALTVDPGVAFPPAGYFDGGSNAAFVNDTGFLIADGSALALGNAGGVLTVIPETGAAPVPQPGEAKYDRRYLLVANKTAGNLAVFVQYETIAASTGDWTWLPNDPMGRQAVGYRLAAGQELALKRDDWQLNARRVRIWAVAENGECYDQFRDEDLWLVEQQVNGERYYVASTVQTFPLAFGEEPGAR